LSVVAQRFGENLTSAREGSGVTQEELSFRAGLHRTEIGLLEAAAASPVSTPSQSSPVPWGCPRPACSTGLLGSRANSRAAASGSGLRMRPRNEANNKRDQQNPKARRQDKKQANKERSQNRKAKRSKRKDPKRQPKEELKQQPPNRRHTTNLFDSCLGRSLMISNVRKAPA